MRRRRFRPERRFDEHIRQLDRFGLNRSRLLALERDRLRIATKRLEDVGPLYELMLAWFGALGHSRLGCLGDVRLVAVGAGDETLENWPGSNFGRVLAVCDEAAVEFVDFHVRFGFVEQFCRRLFDLRLIFEHRRKIKIGEPFVG